MKTKKIILLIITLALVCVAGFSGVVGAFADDLKSLQDIPFITVSDTNKDSYGLSINCKLNLHLIDSNGSSDGVINAYVTYIDVSTGAFLGGSPTLGHPAVDHNLSAGDYYSSPLLIQRTDTYQVVYVFYPLAGDYFNTFSDLPYITNITISNNDGTSPDVALSSTVPLIGLNSFVLVIPPLSYYPTINVNVELGYRSYTDEEYETLRSNYNNMQGQYDTLNTNYRTLQGQYITLNNNYTTLQGRYLTLESNYEEANNRIDVLEETIANNDRYIEALEEANQGLSQNYHNLQEDYNALEIEYLNSIEDYEYLLDEANNQISALQHMVTEEPVAAGFGWIVYAFEKVGQILEIELLPNISIGLLCLIPLVLGVVFFVLRLIRGE